MLTSDDITKYANRKNVRKIAVENFLSTLSGNKLTDLVNLDLDTRLYKWNAPTRNAIQSGILKAYKKG